MRSPEYRECAAMLRRFTDFLFDAPIDVRRVDPRRRFDRL